MRWSDAICSCQLRRHASARASFDGKWWKNAPLVSAGGGADFVDGRRRVAIAPHQVGANVDERIPGIFAGFSSHIAIIPTGWYVVKREFF